MKKNVQKIGRKIKEHIRKHILYKNICQYQKYAAIYETVSYVH